MHLSEAVRMSTLATLITGAILSGQVLAQSSGASSALSSRSQQMPMHEPTRRTPGTSVMRMPEGSGMTPSSESSSLPLPIPGSTAGQASGMKLPTEGASGSMGGMGMDPGVVGMPASGGIRLPAYTTGLTLEQLTSMALQFNPTLVQAQAQVEASMSKSFQAGLMPNPVAGYVSEQMGSGGAPGFRGNCV